MADSADFARNVAIIGGGGQLGKVAIKALLDTGKHKITAITRPESNSSLPDGVDTIKIDYTSADTSELTKALRGKQALVIALAVGAPRDLLPRLIRAADTAGVPYVFPNYWGFDPNHEALAKDVLLTDMIEGLHEVFAECKTSKYLLLACGMWFEFSIAGGPDRYGFDFKKRTFIQFDNVDVLMSVTTWPQVGRAIAALLSLPLQAQTPDQTALSMFGNKAVYVQSFTTSQRQIWDAIKRVTKTTDHDWTISHGAVGQRYQDGLEGVQAGNFSCFQKMLYSRQFFESADAHHVECGLANESLGLPKENFDDAVATAIRMGENGEIPFEH